MASIDEWLRYKSIALSEACHTKIEINPHEVKWHAGYGLKNLQACEDTSRGDKINRQTHNCSFGIVSLSIMACPRQDRKSIVMGL